jgi:hypothetical protein
MIVTSVHASKDIAHPHTNRQIHSMFARHIYADYLFKKRHELNAARRQLQQVKDELDTAWRVLCSVEEGKWHDYRKPKRS